MREAIKASGKLVLLTFAYILCVAACQHTQEIGYLLDGVCKVAVHMLESSNNAVDAGIPSDH